MKRNEKRARQGEESLHERERKKTVRCRWVEITFFFSIKTPGTEYNSRYSFFSTSEEDVLGGGRLRIFIATSRHARALRVTNSMVGVIFGRVRHLLWTAHTLTPPFPSLAVDHQQKHIAFFFSLRFTTNNVCGGCMRHEHPTYYAGSTQFF